MNRIMLIVRVLILLTVFGCNTKKQEKQNYEIAEKNGCKLHTYVNNNPHEVKMLKANKSNEEVKNVILLIGDGMGLNVVQAAWVANKGKLFMDNADYIGLMKTTALDSIITDSAAAGTAMATGSKTNRGVLGVTPDGASLKTICECAHEKGLGTGVISSARIYDATPAAFSVENIDRNDSDTIAELYVKSNVDFVLGGGMDYFTNRKDGKNIIEMLSKEGYQIATSMDSLQNIKEGKVFAVVADHDMPLAPERKDDLWKGTKKALDLLTNNKKGFFLMVESAMIDDFGHGNKLPEMMEETLDFDRIVGKTLAWAAAHPGTLVIVTADHATGGLTLTEGTLEKGEIKGYYSSGHHDGVMVPVYAFGAGAENFTGVYDNTDLCKKMKAALGL